MQPWSLAIVLLTAAWIAYDASRRDWTEDRFANATWKWVVGSIFLWIIVLPVYLVKRRKALLKP